VFVLCDRSKHKKGNGVAWRVSQGHDQEGTSWFGYFRACFCLRFSKEQKSVSWHPHVSHWFASSGLDGAVRVWDARATKTPVRDSPLAHGGGLHLFVFVFVVDIWF
jgi:WD40 repeat protein